MITIDIPGNFKLEQIHAIEAIFVQITKSIYRKMKRRKQ